MDITFFRVNLDDRIRDGRDVKNLLISNGHCIPYTQLVVIVGV